MDAIAGVEPVILTSKVSRNTCMLGQMAFAFMALVYTYVLCVFVLMNGQLCRLVRILSVILKDAAYISS